MQKITEIDVLAEFNRLIAEMLELERFRELDQQINSVS